MSAETSAWAKEQQCGDRTVKAVLCEIANWASPDGVVKFLHIKRIAEVIEVTPRTVKRCLSRLEEPTLECPDRLGLIRRVARFRDDGGQSASGFELIGYQPPFAARTPGDKMSPPRDTHVTPPGDNLSREGVTPVSPLNRDKNTLPPLSANADKTPAADFDDQGEGSEPASGAPAEPAKAERGMFEQGRRQARGTRLPDDWAPPPIADLPPLARKLVEQWPSGAYEAVCETFRLHWHSETRAVGCKRDWAAALGKWLISDHSKIMRDAKAGISFAHLAPARQVAGAKPAPRAVAAKAREDERSAALHAALRQELGQQLYQTWIEGTALIHDAPGVLVIVPSEFQRAWIEDRFQQQVQAAARAVMGSGVRWVRFQVEQQTEGQARS